MSSYASLFTGENRSDAPQPVEENAPYRLLIVDDEKNVLSALRRVFQRENYEVHTVESAEAALGLMEQIHFHLVISDYLMPGMDGAAFLKLAKQKQPEMIRIMLTGHADINAVMGAVKEGAVYRFILKPWNDDDLRVTVALALEQYDLIQKNKHLSTDNRRKERQLGLLSKMAVTNRSQLAIMLHKRGILSDKQLQEIYKLQQNRKESVLKLLLDRDWVEEAVIRKILRNDFLVEEVSLAESQPDPAALELVPKSYCDRHWVLPLAIDGKTIRLAVADPLDDGLVEDMRFVTGMDVKTVMSNVADIRKRVDELYGESDAVSFEDLHSMVSGNDPYEGIEVVIEDDDETAIEDLLRSTEEPPAIRLVNAIIIEAVRLGVSDIHIQPRTKNIVVRYRIDGVLHDKIHVPHYMYPSLVSRIKVMAELDIAERRRPQDGRITVKTPLRIVDLRISMLPTITGEKVVMRVLDRNASIHTLEELGLLPKDLTRVQHMISRPQGIILATGPTGSGKTTTLYSLLQHDATPTKNYVTIEDPVEFFLDQAGQVYVREKVGLTFPLVLRAILRQDPDVILLGEIRDFETAEVAFHAALTGHLVFSTLHTNSASATVARLFDMGLKPFVIASALQGIIAQRLVRRICEHCKGEESPDPLTLERLGPEFMESPMTFYAGRGCRHCNESGYKGRIPLYEVLSIDDELRELIGQGASMFDLEQAARRMGVTSLLDDAREKIAMGLTTADEVLRVLGSQVKA